VRVHWRRGWKLVDGGGKCRGFGCADGEVEVCSCCPSMFLLRVSRWYSIRGLHGWTGWTGEKRGRMKSRGTGAGHLQWQRNGLQFTALPAGVKGKKRRRLGWRHRPWVQSHLRHGGQAMAIFVGPLSGVVNHPTNPNPHLGCARGDSGRGRGRLPSGKSRSDPDTSGRKRKRGSVCSPV